MIQEKVIPDRARQDLLEFVEDLWLHEKNPTINNMLLFLSLEFGYGVREGTHTIRMMERLSRERLGAVGYSSPTY